MEYLVSNKRCSHILINESRENRVKYDWGDSIEGGWRTLTKDEWLWVLYGRTDAFNKLTRGTVNGVHGLILLSGKWTLPEGCSFTPVSIGL